MNLNITSRLILIEGTVVVRIIRYLIIYLKYLKDYLLPRILINIINIRISVNLLFLTVLRKALDLFIIILLFIKVIILPIKALIPFTEVIYIDLFVLSTLSLIKIILINNNNTRTIYYLLENNSKL